MIIKHTPLPRFRTVLNALFLIMAGGVFLMAAQITGAFAQTYTPNRKIVKDAGLPSYTSQRANIISLRNMEWMLINPADTPDHIILMNIRIPTPVEGCLNVTPFQVLEKQYGFVKEFNIILPQARTPNQYKRDHYSCNDQSQNIGVNIPINMDELKDLGLTTIKFKVKDLFVSYEVYTDKNKIILTPKNNPALEPFAYWFLPKNTVIVTIPAYQGTVEDNQDVLNQILREASENNLTPIEDSVIDYTPNINRPGRFYFIDEKGSLAKRLSPATPLQIGSVTQKEAYYGHNGQYMKDVSIPVYAALPDQYD